LGQCDMQGICEACYKLAKNPVRVLNVPPEVGFFIGLGQGFVDFGTAFLGRTFKLPDRPDYQHLSEDDLVAIRKIREDLMKDADTQRADQFFAWCDRLGIPH